MKINDTPLFYKPLPFYGKSELPLFLKILKTQPPRLYKEGVPTMQLLHFIEEKAHTSSISRTETLSSIVLKNQKKSIVF